MVQKCTKTDCYCGQCSANDITAYHKIKEANLESDEYGQTPNCEICNKEWAECNPVFGPHTSSFIQQFYEGYWITAAVALNYFGPSPKQHPFATPANIHEFVEEYIDVCLKDMKETIEKWLKETESELIPHSTITCPHGYVIGYDDGSCEECNKIEVE